MQKALTPKTLWPSVLRTGIEATKRGVWVIQESEDDPETAQQVFIPWVLWGSLREAIDRESLPPDLDV